MALLPYSHYYIADKGGSSSHASLVLSGWLTSVHVLPQRGPGSILSAISGEGLIMVPYLLNAKEGTFPSPMPPHGIREEHDLLFWFCIYLKNCTSSPFQFFKDKRCNSS